MAKFNVGDRVKVVNLQGFQPRERDALLGRVGEVISVDNRYNTVRLDEDAVGIAIKNNFFLTDSELELTFDKPEAPVVGVSDETAKALIKSIDDHAHALENLSYAIEVSFADSVADLKDIGAKEINPAELNQLLFDLQFNSGRYESASTGGLNSRDTRSLAVNDIIALVKK